MALYSTSTLSGVGSRKKNSFLTSVLVPNVKQFVSIFLLVFWSLLLYLGRFKKSLPAKKHVSQVLYWFGPQRKSGAPPLKCFKAPVSWDNVDYLPLSDASLLLLQIGVSIFGNSGEDGKGSLPRRSNLFFLGGRLCLDYDEGTTVAFFKMSSPLLFSSDSLGWHVSQVSEDHSTFVESSGTWGDKRGKKRLEKIFLSSFLWFQNHMVSFT